MVKSQPVAGSPTVSALIDPVEHALTPLEEMIPLEEKRLHDEHAALEDLFQRVRSVLETLPKAPAQGTRLQELLTLWQSEWDTVAAQLVNPLHPLPEAFLNLKDSCAAARAFLTQLQRPGQKMNATTVTRWQALWEGRHRPALEKSKTLAEEARHEQTRCMERVQHLAQRYLDLAGQLRDRI